MADYSVKLVITNLSTNQEINFEEKVEEETAKKIFDAYTSNTDIMPYTTLDDIS